MLYLLIAVIALFVLSTYVAIRSGIVRSFDTVANAIVSQPVSKHFGGKAGDARRRAQIARGYLTRANGLVR